MEGIEIIGELAVDAIEIASESKSEKGCFVMLLICIVALILIYLTYNSSQQSTVCGKILHKLENNQVLIQTGNSKHLETISSELYQNKKENDSICIQK